MELQAGRHLFVGITGTRLDAEERDFLGEIRPGGVILFSRNVESLEQVSTLIESIRLCLQSTSPFPVIGIDQEWGRVNRLDGLVSPLPAAFDLCHDDDPDHTSIRETAELTASLLRGMGVNLNMAPVIDLYRDGVENGIGRRAYHEDPEIVVRCASAYLEGLHSAGVFGVLKHFPGLGNTEVDSHTSLPLVRSERQTLMRHDLLPFRRLLKRFPGQPVMVSHGSYPALESSGCRISESAPAVPASLSPAIIGGLLRSKLGHRGVVLTDDLEMGAVTGDGEEFDPFCGIKAVLATADWALICHRRERILTARDELVRELRSSAALRRLSDDAMNRLDECVAGMTNRPGGLRLPGWPQGEKASPVRQTGPEILETSVARISEFSARWENRSA